MCKINPTRFYSKNGTRIKQGCDKKIPKTSVEQTKGNVGFYLCLFPLGT